MPMGLEVYHSILYPFFGIEMVGNDYSGLCKSVQLFVLLSMSKHYKTIGTNNYLFMRSLK